MNKKNGFSILLILALLLSYQNCEKVKFDSPSSNPKITAVCVPGKKLSIHLADANQTHLGDIVTYSGNISAVENYHYENASAHPINGPVPVGNELHSFFYDGADGLTFNFYGNVDLGPNAVVPDVKSQFSIKILTSKNNHEDGVLFVDDPLEGQGTDQTEMLNGRPVGENNEYSGAFHYGNHTDGGIIGPFNGEDFEIHVEVLDTFQIDTARFYSADGTSFNLGSNQSAYSYIIKFNEFETCQ